MNWQFGCCSLKADKAQARKNLKTTGWLVIKHEGQMKDICPDCYEKEEWLK